MSEENQIIIDGYDGEEPIVLGPMIAFKRTKACPTMLGVLHPEFIVEHADTTLFPENFHKESEGYEFLNEYYFKDELAKNEELHEEHIEAKKAEEIAKRALAPSRDEEAVAMEAFRRKWRQENR